MKRDLLMIALFLLLVGCSSTEVASFTGTIEEINGEQALVRIDKGEILNSGNQVHVDLSVASDKVFQIGDSITVEYDGEIRESFPLGINTISVNE